MHCYIALLLLLLLLLNYKYECRLKTPEIVLLLPLNSLLDCTNLPDAEILGAALALARARACVCVCVCVCV